MLVDRFGNAFQQFQTGEQDTGLKWQDGRPIYRNYKKIDLSNVSLSGEVSINANDFDFVWIDPCSCLWSAQSYSAGADHYFYPVNYAPSYDNNYVNAVIHNNNLSVSVGNAFSGWYNVFYIYYLYVKKN